MWPFRRSKGSALALIHVGPQEVTSGFVWSEEGKKMALCATAHATIRRKEGEGSNDSLARAITEACDELLRTGAAALRTAAGNAKIDRVIVGLQCPWQSGVVETKKIQPAGGFTYTRAMEREVLGEGQGAHETEAIEKRVAATLLNGYLTKNPFGKLAKHAELVVFVSKTDVGVREAVSASVRRSFHTSAEPPVSFDYAATCALQSLHPEIKDFLMLSATPRSVEVVSVKRGHIVDAANGTEGTDPLIGKVRKITPASEESVLPTSRQPGYVAPKPKVGTKSAQDEARREWADSLLNLLKGCAARHALPRTLFLIVEEEAREALTATLNQDSLRSLWLSDEPITIVALKPQHLSTIISTRGAAEGNVSLALLAAYASQQ